MWKQIIREKKNSKIEKEARLYETTFSIDHIRVHHNLSKLQSKMITDNFEFIKPNRFNNTDNFDIKHDKNEMNFLIEHM